MHFALPEEDWSLLASIWTRTTARRKEIMTRAGDVERYLYFVEEGVQRVFYTDDQAREATIVFTYAPSFGGVLDSLLMQQPSRYFYETLTPSVFLRTPFAEMQRLMDGRPAVSAMVRQSLNVTLSGVLERLVELQCFSSEDKFKRLLQRSPHILQLVPHKYLANYLGMDATNFSKFMNRVRI
ncbi:cyclic nucleotide-binding domain-containing protein [Fulvivirgaceae bacterium PWU5]|uniref:Cyclic nucleotide-binding domain-containing protein n=2 Tax=Dawidia cretensis TaxID=2782350 RepID=A0AAP2DZE1_9BACT|nr:cyclic nucleotide-binding domain-containing protein [Dawidia cretensis]